jgi:oligopeptidase B
VFALAHIRGGGEFGLYAAGRRLDKINSVTDFLSCAHHLIDIRVADPERIVAHVSAADSGGCGSSRFKKPSLVYALPNNR